MGSAERTVERAAVVHGLTGPLQKQLADLFQVGSESFWEPESENFSLKGQFREASGSCVNGENSGDRGLAQGREVTSSSCEVIAYNSCLLCQFRSGVCLF